MSFRRLNGPPIHPPVASRHWEYVFLEGTVYVYDMGKGQSLIKKFSIPGLRGERGMSVDPATNSLYITTSGSNGRHPTLMRYDLVTNQVLYNVTVPAGIDSHTQSWDGKTIYMPSGSITDPGVWSVMDAQTGHVTSTISAGSGPHNTIMGLSGKQVYLGPIHSNYLYIADTATKKVIRSIGPLLSGVRPFTINGAETLAFISVSGFLGFQVGNINTGRVLYTVRIPGNPGASDNSPTHGEALTPDEKELWVLDDQNNKVHVFDITGLPASPPMPKANITLEHRISGNESPCTNNCPKEGWLSISRDGRFAYVGDSGDVIDTATKTILAYLPPMNNSRHFIEIDWNNGHVVGTSTRYGLGYVVSNHQ